MSRSLNATASEYVRRSVANHLNDLSREKPDLVVATARRWLDASDANTVRLVRNDLRTLVKNGHPGALELLGFTPATIEIDGPLVVRTTVLLGGSIRFTARIRNTGTDPARLSIDYVIHHRKTNSGQTGKTFKLTTRTLAPGDTHTIDRAAGSLTVRRWP